MKAYTKFVMVSAMLVFAAGATTMLTVQRVNAIGTTCQGCAKDFAPGQQLKK